MKKNLLLIKNFIVLFFVFSVSIINAQNTNTICETALPVCPDSNFGLDIVSEVGADPAPPGPDYGCLGSQPNPLWYYMQISQSGLAGFDLQQWTGPGMTGSLIDVDFALWGPFTSQDACDQLTTANLVDSSYDPTGDEFIDFFQGTCGAEPTENLQQVNAGDWYILLITNFSGDPGYINLIPGQDATASFNCSILGPTYYFCDEGEDCTEPVNLLNYSAELADNNPNVLVTYHNSQAEANNAENAIVEQFDLTCDDSPLTLYARLDNLVTSEVQVVIVSFELITPPELTDQIIEECDDNDDGLLIFDLTAVEADIIGDLEDPEVSYYETEEDANNEENPIADPANYESGDGIVYVRVGFGICYSVATITLDVIESLVLNPFEFGVCDTGGDGEEVFDLTTFNDEILGDLTGTVTYFNSQEDAENQIDPIDNATSYTVGTGTTVIYVRVDSGDCFGITTLTITLNPSPVATDILVEICDSENDISETVDLTSYFDQIVGSQEGVSATYHLTQEDADNNVNPIDNPESFVVSENPQLIYVRIFIDECFDVGIINFNLLESPSVQDATLTLCDNDGNGTEVFDLSQANIFNRGAGDSVSYHPTQEDAENDTNEITDFTNYTSGEGTVYVRVVNAQGCVSIAVITLDLIDSLDINPIENYTVCDENGDGSEVIDLTSFNDEILGSVAGDVTFYNSQEDAENQTNDITNATTFNVNTGTTVVYVRVDSGNCFGITTITINLQANPIAQDVVVNDICDFGNDDMENVDLTAYFDAVSGGQSNVSGSYHLTQADAENNANAIATPSNFDLTSNPQVIYVRVFIADCFDVGTITFNLLNSPIVQNDSLQLCDNDGNGTEEFDLTQATVTTETGNVISYHTTQAGAENNTNEISNITAHSSGVSIVYVRVENANGCFSVAEISLEFYPEPVVDMPTDGYSVCSENPIMLDATGEFVYYVWSTGEEGPFQSTIEVDTPGTYTVTVTDANGCTGTHTYNVEQGTAPMITSSTAGPNFIILNATGGQEPYEYSLNGFIWQASNQFNNLPPGIYDFYVRGADGCQSEEIQIAIFDIPTLFTPNEDGINDVWRIPGLEIYPGSTLVVYDRYGKTVYANTPTSNELWDGRDISGNKVPTQDYWYQLFISDGRQFTGHVTVKNRTEKGN